VAKIGNSTIELPETKFAEFDQQFKENQQSFAETMEKIKKHQADDLRFMIPLSDNAARALMVR
jgi:hypothetical protein